ncbi:hypothetical protein WCN91_12470 [Pseudoalteromonas sp. YIC-827]|uniref:Uncharacterized protein n=1 Tax=Pseudoalteromonas qingdaonensis TaxID=3131913 RepID=A0ABU9N0A9_9GAMM
MKKVPLSLDLAVAACLHPAKAQQAISLENNDKESPSPYLHTELEKNNVV